MSRVRKQKHTRGTPPKSHTSPHRRATSLWLHNFPSSTTLWGPSVPTHESFFGGQFTFKPQVSHPLISKDGLSSSLPSKTHKGTLTHNVLLHVVLLTTYCFQEAEGFLVNSLGLHQAPHVYCRKASPQERDKVHKKHGAKTHSLSLGS